MRGGGGEVFWEREKHLKKRNEKEQKYCWCVYVSIFALGARGPAIESDRPPEFACFAKNARYSRVVKSASPQNCVGRLKPAYIDPRARVLNYFLVKVIKAIIKQRQSIEVSIQLVSSILDRPEVFNDGAWQEAIIFHLDPPNVKHFIQSCTCPSSRSSSPQCSWWREYSTSR